MRSKVQGKGKMRHERHVRHSLCFVMGWSMTQAANLRHCQRHDAPPRPAPMTLHDAAESVSVIGNGPRLLASDAADADDAALSLPIRARLDGALGLRLHDRCLAKAGMLP